MDDRRNRRCEGCCRLILWPLYNRDFSKQNDINVINLKNFIAQLLDQKNQGQSVANSQRAFFYFSPLIFLV